MEIINDTILWHDASTISFQAIGGGFVTNLESDSKVLSVNGFKLAGLCFFVVGEAEVCVVSDGRVIQTFAIQTTAVLSSVAYTHTPHATLIVLTPEHILKLTFNT